MCIKNLIKPFIPNPIRQLPWRLKWVRTTKAYADAPLSALFRLFRWTSAECLMHELTFEQDGMKFITMRNNFCGMFAYVAKDYERDLLHFMCSQLRPGAVFCDVGSNIGMYSVAAGRGVGPTGRVIAFEAHPVTYGFLQRNIALNALSNAVVLNQAAGAESGWLDMEYEYGNSGSTHVATADAKARARVPVVRLDDAMRAQGITNVDYMKIDVEGFEVFVLEGAKAIIMSSLNIVIQTEIDVRHLTRYGSTPAQVVGFFESMGFTGYSLTSGGALVPIETEGLNYGDVIWKRV